MGQVSPDSQFGQAIIDTLRSMDVQSICEVGAWNGLGTTACLFAGINNRPIQLYSLEGDPIMYSKAAMVWKDVPNVHLLYGTLHQSVMSRQEIKSHAFYRKVSYHYDVYYTTEEATCLTAPLVSVPKCDCILLDGGEFSTQGDWDALNHNQLKVVMLDDTQVIKTHSIRDLLLRSTDWICTHDFPNDRNGWSIFVRVQPITQ
jgi:hypothetical protein